MADEAPQRVEITSSGALNERRNETATRIVVRREDILRFGDSTLSEVLKRLPGVTVAGDVRMRGLGNGYTQILLNSEATPPGFAIDSIAPELIDRIEILRSASAEFSTQAIAGTINVVLRKHVTRNQREFKAGMGNDQGHWNPSLSWQLADRDERLTYALAGSLSRTGYFVNSRVDEAARDRAGRLRQWRRFDDKDYSDYQAASLAPRLSWTLADGETLTWQSWFNVYRISSWGDERESTLLGQPSSYPLNDWRSMSRTRSIRSDASWMRRIDDSTEVTAKFGIDANRRDTDFNFAGAGADGTGRVRRVVLSNAIDNTFNSSGKLRRQLAGEHGVALGWDGALIRRSELRRQRDTFPSHSGALDEDYAAAVRRLALFVQDEWTPLPRVQAYLGLRWEGLGTDVEGEGVVPVHTYASVWSPLGQLLWKLPGSDKDQLRAAFSRTYKVPPTRSLIPRRYVNNNDNSPTNPDVQGNAQLRPELAWGVDVAWESYFSQGGMASVAASMRRIDGAAVQQLFEQGGRWISMPANAASARVASIEFDARLPLRRWLVTMPQAELRFNVGRNWSQVDAIPGPDNRLGEQIPLSANLGIDLQPLTGSTAGLNFSYQSAAPVRVTPVLGRYAGPARVLDAYWLLKLPNKTQLRLALSNALHQDRTASRHYNDGDTSTIRAVTTPGTAGVRMTLEKAL